MNMLCTLREWRDTVLKRERESEGEREGESKRDKMVVDYFECKTNSNNAYNTIDVLWKCLTDNTHDTIRKIESTVEIDSCVMLCIVECAREFAKNPIQNKLWK